MMASFKKVSVPLRPAIKEKEETTDTLYWKDFQSPIVAKEFGAVTRVEFSPVSPHDLAVTNSTRVQIYDSRSLQISRILQRFQRQALSGSFRRDGGLVVAGTEDGLVKVFDHQNNALLRSFNAVHSGPVHVTRFLPDNVHLVSASDDRNVKILDVPSEAVVHTFEKEFDDYIRCGCVAPGAAASTFAMGGYDHMAKIFDIRTKNSVMTLDHSFPIDSCVFLPSGSMLLTAGSTHIKAWDLLTGKLVRTFSKHHKSITSLALASEGRRLISGGLDKHVKVYDSATLDVVASLDYPSPILSVAVSPNDATIAVGMTDGLLSIKRRNHSKNETEPKSEAKMPRVKKKRSGRVRVTDADLGKADQVVRRRLREKLEPYDFYFKKFQHSKALDEALKYSVRVNTPEVTLAVMEELMRRERLKAAIAGRTDNQVSVLLTFLTKNFSNMNFQSTVMDSIEVLMDTYGLCKAQGNDMTGPVDSEFADEYPRSISALKKLMETIQSEVIMQKQFLKVSGMMEPILKTGR